MSLNVDDFKAKLTGGGARPNLFRVTLNMPLVAEADVELASFMVKGATLPGATIGEIAIPFRGRQLKVAGDKIFENWVVTVINDGNFSVRNSLERWSNFINSHSTNVGPANPADYYADMEVEQLDKGGNVVKTYKIVGGYPTNLAPIELNYDSTDTIEEFTCDFAYQYWEASTTN